MHRRARLGSRVGGALVASLAVVAGAGACTTGASRALRPAVDGPTFTTVAEAPPVPRLDAPRPAKGEVSRLTVRIIDADGSFRGQATQQGTTRAGQRYRLTGRCVSEGSGGVLAVDVMGPVRGGADGAPSEPLLGDPVASATFRCDEAQATVDLPPLPAGASEIMPNPRTGAVAAGWVVLSTAS
jgi:hypothetical protein